MTKKTDPKDKKPAQKAGAKDVDRKPAARKPAASSESAGKAAEKKQAASKTEKKASSANQKAASEKRQTPVLPEPTFTTFILSLASSGMVQLGEVPHPDTGETMVDINLAKHTIDTIAMLRDKTQNCLNPEEKRLVEGLLYELRMKFVMKK